MFPKIDDRESWNAQVLGVCQAYRDAIASYQRQGLHTVSIDEQTGIQALQRIAVDLLPARGRIARREYEYIRHGTLGLFGNLHIATGQILSPLIRHTRTEEDFLENIDGLVSTDPTATWRLITDNLNTHASESMVRYVAASCELETDLGVKGRTGVLKSLASRQAFLSDQNHRIHFLYTPKHCSWLNQIEIWFGTLRRKLTRFGSFHSLDDLQDRILRFIDYYNQSMARPYRWTCDGAVLCK
ncbi:MAG: transposase [Pirellulaceae bacterium]